MESGKQTIKIKREFVGKPEDAERLRALQMRLVRKGAKPEKKEAA